MREDDHILREALRDLAPTVGEKGVWNSLQSRVAAKRRAHQRRLVLASAAVVVIACLGLGGYAISEWWPHRASVLVITDDATGVSPGSTGQAVQSADSAPSAAMFGGNAARTGVYPSGGPTDPPELLWKFKTGEGEGTSPVVSDGVVYVASVDGLYAVDAGSGEERWKYPWWTYYGGHSCPAVSDGVVYIGSDSGQPHPDDSYGGYLHALDAESGQEVWRFEKTGETGFSSPAVSDGAVYFGTGDGHLYALDAQSGELKWEFFTSYGQITSPAVSEGVVYFSNHDGYLYALDAQTGQEEWSIKPSYSYASSDPAVFDGVVYFANNGPRYLHQTSRLHAFDAQTGEEKWTFEADGTLRSSLAVTGSAVYFLYEDTGYFNSNEYSSAGIAVAVDAFTGKELWRFAAANDSGFWGIEGSSSPSISGDVVYFGTADADTRLHALDAFTGQELWTWAISRAEVADTSPAISDGVVYFSACDDYLYALK